jgi:hypothetical protein
MEKALDQMNREELKALIDAEGLGVKIVGTNEAIVAAIVAARLARNEQAGEKPSARAPKALALVDLFQGGKPVKGEPVADVYVVALKVDVKPEAAPAAVKIVDELKAAYPGCAFVFVTKRPAVA